MRLRIDLARENALAARDRDGSHSAAQLVARAVDGDVDLGAGAFELAALLRLALRFGDLDDLVTARAGLVHDAARLLACGRDDLFGFALRLREIVATPLRGGQAGGDLLLP